MENKIVQPKCDTDNCIAYRTAIDNKKRIEKLEDNKEKSNTVIALISQKLDTFMDSQQKSINALSVKIDELIGRPAKRWDGLVTVSISAVVGGLIAIALTNLF